MMEREKKRFQVDDAQAIHNQACDYKQGIHGLSQDRDKALELWHRAAELGYTASYHNIGNAYFYGRGVEKSEKKAMHYWGLAAMGGVVEARHNLGLSEANKCNHERAIKHFMIAVGSGYNDSLTQIKQLYTTGRATKDDYAKALKAYQAYLSEIKSKDRDKAAEYDERFQYYE